MGKKRQSALLGPRTESPVDTATEGPTEENSTEAASAAAAAARMAEERRVGETAGLMPWER